MSILSSLRWYSVRYHLKEWGSLALLVAVIVGPLTLFGWLFFSTDTFTVQSITVVDARPHTTEALQNLARKTLGHNILFVNTARLEREALQAFPQIRDIYIARTLPGTLKLVVQEKEPALLLLSGGTYYVLDEQGIVYEEARFDTLPGTVLPIVKNTGEAGEIVIGSPAVETEFISFIHESLQKLTDVTKAQIAEIRIPSLAAREAQLLLENNWILRLDTTRPLAVQLSVLDKLLAHTITEEQKQDIEYIDLRIPNRAYYKLRQ